MNEPTYGKELVFDKDCLEFYNFETDIFCACADLCESVVADSKKPDTYITAEIAEHCQAIVDHIAAIINSPDTICDDIHGHYWND